MEATPSATSSRRWRTLECAGEHYGCSPQHLRRMIASGDITGYRLGKRMLRVDLNEIDLQLHPVTDGTQS